MIDLPPRDGSEFWAIIENRNGSRWPMPVKVHWQRAAEPMREYWGDGLDAFSADGFEMALWRGDAIIGEWWIEGSPNTGGMSV